MFVPRRFIRFVAGALLAAATLAGPAAAQPQGIEGEIAAVETRAAEGQAANWAQIAPKQFAEAQQKLAEAKQKFGKGGKIEDIRAKLKEATQKLDAVARLEEMGKLLLRGALEARADALAADAPQYAAKQWESAEEAIEEAGREVEKGDQNKTRSKAEVAQDLYRSAELEAIRTDLLGTAHASREAALTAGADKKAPKTFAAADAMLNGAEDVLRGDRYQRATAKEQAREASRGYLRASIIAGRSDAAGERNTGTVESLVLDYEQSLGAICESLKIAPDFSQGPKAVSDAVVSALGSLYSDRGNLQSELADQTARLAQSAATIDSLDAQLAALEQRQRSTTAAMQAEQERQQALEKVRGLFEPAEAQVLQDGSDLIIRMHGLSFPTGSSEIRPENFQLLTKLQQALRVYPNAPVAIEGHTDARGNDDVNQALSLRRATAVQDYLQANMGGVLSRFSAVGFGESKPIASNETEAGRAMNRRIDVRIKTAG